jgi:hypothetical protein
VHRRPHHPKRDCAHLLEVPQHRGVPRQAVDQPGDLGDVHRLVGDALQMQVDVQQRRQQPQVGCDRGLEREQSQDPSLDVEVEPVHFVVAADHLVADHRVAAFKGHQRLLQQKPGLGAGSLNVVLEGAQLLVVVPPDLTHQPNLPVLLAAVSGLTS